MNRVTLTMIWLTLILAFAWVGFEYGRLAGQEEFKQVMEAHFPPPAFPDLNQCDQYQLDAQSGIVASADIVSLQSPIQDPALIERVLRGAATQIDWGRVCFHAAVEEIFRDQGWDTWDQRFPTPVPQLWPGPQYNLRWRNP